ncbi:MAG: hypothetical protein AAF329_18685 [Cyanobacteria bacterium P01_A01_bin.17]
MANALHLPVQSQQPEQHQANMEETLAHRTDVAQVHQDRQLLTLLQQEKEQLERSKQSVSSHLSLWQRLTEIITKRNRISLEEIQGPSGKVAWHAYDPRTGQSWYAETSAEMVTLLEAHRLIR